MSIMGDNIRKFRELKGYTQKELADKVGKSKNVISNWENGLNKPDPDSIELLLWALDVDANTLLGWKNRDNLKLDANELASKVLANPKIQKMLATLSTMSDSDMDLVISFIERLNK